MAYLVAGSLEAVKAEYNLPAIQQAQTERYGPSPDARRQLLHAPDGT